MNDILDKQNGKDRNVDTEEYRYHFHRIVGAPKCKVPRSIQQSNIHIQKGFIDQHSKALQTRNLTAS